MRFAVFVCLLLLPFLALSQARRAKSLIEKEKLQDAYLLLRKALAKDSLASAEKYVLSGLYFNNNFEHNNLDSAYHYILEAVIADELIETKLRETLSNRGFSLEVYSELKAQIEEAGFKRAIVGGKEKDFIDFLIEFNTSIHIDSAINLRNEVAYSTVSKEHTYEAYQHFFFTYPQAKQVPESRKRYEELLYEEKTASGKLKSYQVFLQDFPDTWHRLEAEQIIYNIITGVFTPEAYEEFVNQYPDNHLSEEANLSKYSLLDRDKRVEFLSGTKLSADQRDSITSLNNKVDQLLIPTIHEHKYQIFNAKGHVLLDNLEDISEADKCQIANSGLILASLNNTKAILNLEGSILLEDHIASLVDEGNGLIRLNNGESDYFIHSGGFRITTNEFSNAFMAGPYIAFKNKSKWGLESVTGLPLLTESYDSILSFHNHLLLKKDNKWGIYPVSHFYPLLDGEKIELMFIYNQIMVLNNDYLLLANGNETALMNKDGTLIIPMADQGIELVDGGYFVDRGDSLLDSRVAKTWYYNISNNENWIIGDKGSEIDVYYHNKSLFRARDAQLVGNTALRVVLGDSTYCFFNDTIKLSLAADDLIIPIRRMGENSSTRHFIYTDSEGEQMVYDNTGKQLYVGKYDKLIDLGKSYLLRRNKGSFDVLNNDGKEVLEDIDAATSLKNGYVSYLADGKFGLFNAEDNTDISPKYDRPLTAYSDTLFVATSDNKYGIVDKYDSIIVPLRYNEVRYLNDTIVMLSRDFRWLFWDINQSSSLLSNVSDYWIIEKVSDSYYKIFKGIGYGIWSPENGLLLNPTFSEINIISKGDETVFIAEKWVEEADLVVMLYYDKHGSLITKEVISTAEYEALKCKKGED
ncbi:MAG: hypothetical protein DRI71_03185 [Bacteroidetes bacterium]|nr:MAG: hypothetical protein DRI71_03185 [Bacteroidota bacterium]